MLKLCADIYTVAAIQEAVGVFADFAEFDWHEEPESGYFAIGISAADDVDPVELVGEFGNYVLTRSIEARA